MATHINMFPYGCPDLMATQWFQGDHKVPTQLHPLAVLTSSLTLSIWNLNTIDYNMYIPPAFLSFCSELLTATNLSMTAILHGLYFIFRLRNSPSFPYRDTENYILVLSLMLSDKILEDASFSNKSWADVAGLECAHLNYLEKEALVAMDYNLNVKPETFERWLLLLDYNPPETEFAVEYQSPDFIYYNIPQNFTHKIPPLHFSQSPLFNEYLPPYTDFDNAAYLPSYSTYRMETY
jgi:hypothetical protein